VGKDIVPSVSRGAILDVECMLVELCREKFLPKIESGNYDAEQTFQQLKAGIPKWSVDTTLHEPLYVSRNVLWIRDDGRIYRARAQDVSTMILSRETVHDHMPSVYEMALSQLHT